MTRLAEAFDRYGGQTPYDVLGVSPDAGAGQIRDKHAELTRNLNEAGHNPSERAKQKERLDSAYNQLRVAGNRMRIDFFLLDARVGLKQCEAIAKNLAKPATDVQGVIKPRRIRVTHEALVDDLKSFEREPGKVLGLHPKPIDIAEQFTLPEPLAIQFDC